MGWKDSIADDSKPQSSWRDTVTDDTASSDPNPLTTDLREAAAGATFGLDDEIQGALGAAGRVAGVKNLGSWKPFDANSHLEYDSPTLDQSDIVKAYIANRDSARGEKEQDSQNFPMRTAAANLAGGAIGPMAVASTIRKGLASEAAPAIDKSASWAREGLSEGLGSDKTRTAIEIAKKIAKRVARGALLGH